MSNVSFKYCALHYLNQWLAKDKQYYEALAEGDEGAKLKALKDAAAFYLVARNLHKKYEEKKGLPRFKPVLDIIDPLASDTFRGEQLIPELGKVRDAISDFYGGRKVLSVTTKLLWMKIRHPIIIYDSRARRALKAKPDDVRGYYEKWQRRFLEHSQEIDIACTSLQDVLDYTVKPELATASYVSEISRERWFKERVLDIYLWHLGPPGS